MPYNKTAMWVWTGIGLVELCVGDSSANLFFAAGAIVAHSIAQSIIDAIEASR